MNKYGPKARKTISQAMERYKYGQLESGRGGSRVKSRRQAIAIGISEARQKRQKVPKNTN